MFSIVFLLFGTDHLMANTLEMVWRGGRGMRWNWHGIEIAAYEWAPIMVGEPAPADIAMGCIDQITLFWLSHFFTLHKTVLLFPYENFWYCNIFVFPQEIPPQLIDLLWKATSYTTFSLLFPIFTR